MNEPWRYQPSFAADDGLQNPSTPTEGGAANTPPDSAAQASPPASAEPSGAVAPPSPAVDVEMFERMQMQQDQMAQRIEQLQAQLAHKTEPQRQASGTQPVVDDEDPLMAEIKGLKAQIMADRQRQVEIENAQRLTTYVDSVAVQATPIIEQCIAANPLTAGNAKAAEKVRKHVLEQIKFVARNEGLTGQRIYPVHIREWFRARADDYADVLTASPAAATAQAAATAAARGNGSIGSAGAVTSAGVMTPKTEEQMWEEKRAHTDKIFSRQ